MTSAAKQTADAVEVVDYDPRWVDIFAAERDTLLAQTGAHFVKFEHVGSTAIPGQRAKPIIDMMGAIQRLDEFTALLPVLNDCGYQLIDTGMRNRYFLKKHDTASGQVFHLHIVELSTWAERNERLLRDYLLAHPEAVAAYSELKEQIARTHAADSLAYTKAKTAFIQNIIDQARDKLHLPRVDVWED